MLNSSLNMIPNYTPKVNPPQLDSQSLERSQIAQKGVQGEGPNPCNNLIMFIFILLILGAFIMPVNGITIPSDRNKPMIPKEIQKFVTENIPIKEAAPQSNEVVKSERESPPEMPVQLASDPIQIKKFAIPLDSNYYQVGDDIGVFVEIRCKAQGLNSIKVKEFVSDNLNIINCSTYCYRLVSQEEIRDYMSRSNKEYFKSFYYDSKINNEKVHWSDRYYINMKPGYRILSWNNFSNDTSKKSMENFLKDIINIPWGSHAEYKYLSSSPKNRSLYIYNSNNASEKINLIFDASGKNAILQQNDLSYILKADSESLYGLNNEFDISIDKPRANERYVYWYFIESNKPGFYDSMTTIMSSGRAARDYLDVDFPIPINISYPKPEVSVGLKKLNLLRNEEVDIEYEIKFKEIQTNITKRIEFSPISQFYVFIPKNTTYSYGNQLSFNLSMVNISNPIDRTIKYPNDGEYNLPPIRIDGELYPFQTYSVIVETRFEKYGALIGLIFMLITFLMKDILNGIVFPSGKSKGSTSRSLPWSGIDDQLALNDARPSIGKELIKTFKNNFRALVVLMIFIILPIYWIIFDQPWYIPFSNIKVLP
jgi:hypothetical protein